MGYRIQDKEVIAWIPGFPYERRYDFVVRSIDTGAFIAIEVKASGIGILRMDSKQVDFDTALLATGSALSKPRGYRITGIRYEGASLSALINARWQQGILYRRLQSMGVNPNITK